jgi:hypothetical protein
LPSEIAACKAEKSGVFLSVTATISPSISASGNASAAFAIALNLPVQSSPLRVLRTALPSSILICTR